MNQRQPPQLHKLNLYLTETENDTWPLAEEHEMIDLKELDIHFDKIKDKIIKADTQDERAINLGELMGYLKMKVQNSNANYLDKWAEWERLKRFQIERIDRLRHGLKQCHRISALAADQMEYLKEDDKTPEAMARAAESY